jgi:penicillin-binding protein 4
MRTFVGYILLILMIPFLFVLIFLSYSEWTEAKSVKQILAEHTPIEQIKLQQTSYLTDGAGEVISEITNGQDRIYLEDDQIPSFLKQVFIVAEDRHFYEHTGVNVMAISRALIANSQSDDIEQGGSTITQQLARNLYLTNEKTYNRKLSELLYSYQLEQTLSKSEILELYINAIYFQNGVYGIEAAAQFYFSKTVNDLTRAELAFLAAIPNNPSLYDPLVHFEQTKKRQVRLLNQMVEENNLTQAEFDQLTNEPVILHVSERIDRYPDYVTYVQKEFKDLVAAQEGLTRSLQSSDTETRNKAEQQLEEKTTELLQSGITIHTALDPAIQEISQKAIQAELNDTEIEGAAVVIQHHTHKLVSLIGGTNYKKNSFHRAYQSYRQPGSAIKPLLVYAPYLEETGAPLTSTISSEAYCENGYCPKNYSGIGYGNVTLLKAFAQSYNTTAVRLLEKTGINTSFSYLKPFDFQKVVKKDHVLPAAVGGFTYGMSPLELTSAYTSFQDGTYQPARAIVKVTTREGDVLLEWKDQVQTVWSTQTTTKMRTLLHEVMVNGTAKNAYVPTSYIGGKTGTTNNVNDLWFVGLTEDYTTGVWVGYDLPQSMEHIQSSSPHLTIWRNINK